MIEIKSLANTDFDDIFIAFRDAFADYEFQLNKVELRNMIDRRGFDPVLSFGAFNDKRLVSFTLNGIGYYRGLRTAYDTGTGTHPGFRGKGLAGDVFRYSIPFLKEAGIRLYLLEVLQYNHKAVSVYSKIGFKVSREFDYFDCPVENIRVQEKKSGFIPEIKAVRLQEIEGLDHFHDFYPSWQNSFDSVRRKTENFIILGAYDAHRIVGYAIHDPETGDITQLAVDPGYRRKGIASRLLAEMVQNNRFPTMKLINSETSCHSISAFLASSAFLHTGKQFEMELELDEPGLI